MRTVSNYTESTHRTSLFSRATTSTSLSPIRSGVRAMASSRSGRRSMSAATMFGSLNFPKLDIVGQHRAMLPGTHGIAGYRGNG